MQSLTDTILQRAIGSMSSTMMEESPLSSTQSLTSYLSESDPPPHTDGDAPYSAAEIEANYWNIILLEV